MWPGGRESGQFASWSHAPAPPHCSVHLMLFTPRGGVRGFRPPRIFASVFREQPLISPARKLGGVPNTPQASCSGRFAHLLIQAWDSLAVTHCAGGKASELVDLRALSPAWRPGSRTHVQSGLWAAGGSRGSSQIRAQPLALAPNSDARRIYQTFTLSLRKQ